MSDRTFLIQRYCQENWKQVRGERPFIVTGPQFRAYTTTKALNGYEWEFKQTFIDDIKAAGESHDQLSREIIAELLLREGIVQALWSVDSPNVLAEDDRWRASIEQVAREIPDAGPLPLWVIELLSGMPDPAHIRSYLSDDNLRLEPVPIPSE